MRFSTVAASINTVFALYLMYLMFGVDGLSPNTTLYYLLAATIILGVYFAVVSKKERSFNVLSNLGFLRGDMLSGWAERGWYGVALALAMSTLALFCIRETVFVWYLVLILGVIGYLIPLAARGIQFTLWTLFGLTIFDLQRTVTISSFEDFNYGFYILLMNPSYEPIQIVGLGIAIMLGMVFLKNYEIKSWLFIVIVAIVLKEMLFIYVALVAVVAGVYNGISLYFGMLQHTLKFTHRSDGNSMEHYVITNAMQEWKQVIQAQWGNLKVVITSLNPTFKLLSNLQGSLWAKLMNIVHFIFQLVFMLTYSISYFTVRAVFGFVMIGLQYIVVVVVKAVYVGLLALVRKIEENYLKKQRVQKVCGSCYDHSVLPVYICPHCHSEHADLMPSKHGIFVRLCGCGMKLPNRHKKGRSQLQAKCGACTTPYGLKEAATIVIPVIGEASVGKTSFMLEANRKLIHWGIRDAAELKGLDKTNGTLLHDFMNDTILPTNDFEPKPYILYGERTKQPPVAIQTFDPSGHAFMDSKSIAKLQYLQYADGYVFVIPVDDLLKDDNMTMKNIISRMFIYFQNELEHKMDGKIQTPCAFVFHKSDLVTNFPETSEEIKDWLVAHNARHLLNDIELNFSQYRLFASSVKVLNSSYRPTHVYDWLVTNSAAPIVVEEAKL